MSEKNPNTHRQPTEEEMKKHLATKDKVLLGVRQTHRKTQDRVVALQAKPLLVDRG